MLWNFETHNHVKAIIQDNSCKNEISQFPCEDFPPDVCGGWRVVPTRTPKPPSLPSPPLPPPYLPYLTLIPADQGHVQSHLSTQPEIPAIPYFPGVLQKHILCQMSQSQRRGNIFVCQTISHQGNIRFKNLPETFNDENLVLGNSAP